MAIIRDSNFDSATRVHDQRLDRLRSPGSLAAIIRSSPIEERRVLGMELANRVPVDSQPTSAPVDVVPSSSSTQSTDRPKLTPAEMNEAANAPYDPHNPLNKKFAAAFQDDPSALPATFKPGSYIAYGLSLGAEKPDPSTKRGSKLVTTADEAGYIFGRDGRYHLKPEERTRNAFAQFTLALPGTVQGSTVTPSKARETTLAEANAVKDQLTSLGVDGVTVFQPDATGRVHVPAPDFGGPYGESHAEDEPLAEVRLDPVDPGTRASTTNDYFIGLVDPKTGEPLFIDARDLVDASARGPADFERMSLYTPGDPGPLGSRVCNANLNVGDLLASVASR
jgi:hypothetical protein